MRRAGYEVAVICPRGKKRDTAAYEEIDGVRIHRVVCEYQKGATEIRVLVPDRLEKFREMVAQNIGVNAFRCRLFLHRPAAPALHESVGTDLNQRADLGVRL